MGQCAVGLNNHEPVHNPPVFYHYSLEIDSNDAWCKLLGSYDGTVPDEYAQAPSGWSTWLRAVGHARNSEQDGARRRIWRYLTRIANRYRWMLAISIALTTLAACSDPGDDGGARLPSVE